MIKLIVHILRYDDHELLEDFILLDGMGEDEEEADTAASVRELIETEYDTEENDPA